MKKSLPVFCFILLASFFLWGDERPRVRETGIELGIFTPGQWNSITDVKGVQVGHTTLIQGKNIRTGVTVIFPHKENLFQEKVPAAVYAANGFGKLTGTTQIEELGSLETPIVLTNTLSVPTAADAVIDYVLSCPGNERVGSVNPVVGETNDGYLNDIRGRHVGKKHVLSALEKAGSGPLEEGCVGAGTGTSCFGFKGGIGTSSRRLPPELGGYTVGVLVQTNHGGVLNINGFPAGKELGNYTYQQFLEGEEEGSCMVVVATDAPLLSRNLKRLAKRALLGIARTGGFYSNGSGDYAIAFSTAKEVRIRYSSQPLETYEVVPNRMMSPLFLAAAEACEEAILNSMFKAETMKGRDGRVLEALPVDKVLEMMKNHRFLIGSNELDK
ncbi:MAG: P1 family peptidase [Acidobacteriota bacterium]